MTVLGAVTDDGDSFYCWTEENLTSQQGIWLLGALQERFGEELVVFLDRAGYFYNRDLWEHVSGERATRLSETVRLRACTETKKVRSISMCGTFRRNYRSLTRWKDAGIDSTTGSSTTLSLILLR